MDFLPDGKMIFTERSGKMFIFDEKTQTTVEIKGIPKVHHAGQGGLLDVKVHPDFAKNNFIYFTYSEPMKAASTTAIGRGELQGNELKNFKKLFSANKPNSYDHHYGSRIVFDGKGHVFFGVGDRGEDNEAQNLSRHQGKIIRLNEDGSIPKDNPFVNNKNALPEIWSYGQRNPQGLILHPETKELWEAEFGPMGGDEINLIRSGKNYGWPIITYGKEYSGHPVGKGITKKEGLEQPVTYWVPSISPSGIDFYMGTKFPTWKGNLFLANLSSQHLRRLVFRGTQVVKQEELLKDLDYRFRHVRSGPDGYIYVGTDEGVIGRIRPLY